MSIVDISFASYATSTEKPTVNKVIHSASEFMAQAKAPRFIWERVIQRNLIYSATAKWGHGKTALMLTMAVHIALGREFSKLKVEQSKVLYLAGENPDDIRLRVISICNLYNFKTEDLDGWLYFSEKAFAINHKEISDHVSSQAREHGEFGLIIVDTGVAHHDTDEENSNSEMHKFAVSCREFGEAIGNPAVIVLMHPTQGSTKETLRTRGGGGFAGQIDGELMIWQHESTKQIEFWHSSKFRGGGFSTQWFDLKVTQVEGFTDNFGNEAVSVVALASEKRDSKEPKNLKGKIKEAYQALLHLSVTSPGVTANEWRNAYYKGERTEAKEKSFQRAMKGLIEDCMIESNGGLFFIRANNDDESVPFQKMDPTFIQT